jgi:ribonuclease HI
MIQLYTDGGCVGNPGPGGWAFILVKEDKVLCSGMGAHKATTNNQMELQAVIQGLTRANSQFADEQITVVTDSQYVKNGITQWIHGWKKNGWKTAAKQPVKNQDLWTALDTITQIVGPQWSWVKGHSGNQFNEQCDTLVHEAISTLDD